MIKNMSDPNRRIAITGMGLVCPLGSNKEDLWSALSTGKSGIELLQSIPTDRLPTKVAGEARQFTGKIDDFGPLEKMMKRTIKKGLKVMCREIEMGVAAAQLSLNDAELSPDGFDPDKTGVVYGSDYIMTRPEEFSSGIRKCLDDDGKFHFDDWAEKGLPEVNPLWLLKYLPNMPASHIAIYNDMRGPNNSITLREASSNLAIGEAVTTLLRGSADKMIAGATGTRVHALRSVHVILQEEIAAGDGDPSAACRPFDKDRTGMVLGEGSAALVLEDLAEAKKRGAKILGEIIGHGSSTVMSREGVADLRTAIRNALKFCLKNSGLSPEDVGHIQAHGLGTRHSDAEEAKAIDDIFSGVDGGVPVTAAKSYMGNLGAAGGAVELIAGVQALNHGVLFPILNYETPDPECPINGVTTHDVPSGNNFINLSVTPQGQASAIVVGKFEA